MSNLSVRIKHVVQREFVFAISLHLCDVVQVVPKKKTEPA